MRELVDALVREQAVEIRPVAEVALARELPASLAAVLGDRLGSVSAETAQLLRTAALLGGRFTVTDLAVVLRRAVSDLAASMQEAVEAGIVADSGPELAFRHPLIRQALHESMPESLRTGLHAEAARSCGAGGRLECRAAVVRRGQAAAGKRLGKGLAGPGRAALATRAPQLAVELLRRELEETQVGDAAWDILIVSLVRALIAAGRFEEAVSEASQALEVTTDTARQGERCWMLARALAYAGHCQDATIRSIHAVLAEASLPRIWQARPPPVLAMSERVPRGIAISRALAVQALAAAEEAGDPSATAEALFVLWLADSIGRDHVAALDNIDRALRVMGGDPSHDDLRSSALNSRIFTLQNLDEWQQAELALRDAREFARRTGRPDRGTLFSAAVLRYCLGLWDDALAELGLMPATCPGRAIPSSGNAGPPCCSTAWPRSSPGAVTTAPRPAGISRRAWRCPSRAS